MKLEGFNLPQLSKEDLWMIRREYNAVIEELDLEDPDDLHDTVHFHESIVNEKIQTVKELANKIVMIPSIIDGAVKETDLETARMTLRLESLNLQPSDMTLDCLKILMFLDYRFYQLTELLESIINNIYATHGELLQIKNLCG